MNEFKYEFNNDFIRILITIHKRQEQTKEHANKYIKKLTKNISLVHKMRSQQNSSPSSFPLQQIPSESSRCNIHSTCWLIENNNLDYRDKKKETMLMRERLSRIHNRKQNDSFDNINFIFIQLLSSLPRLSNQKDSFDNINFIFIQLLSSLPRLSNQKDSFDNINFIFIQLLSSLPRLSNQKDSFDNINFIFIQLLSSLPRLSNQKEELLLLLVPLEIYFGRKKKNAF